MHYPPELPLLNMTWEYEQATAITHRYCRAALALGLTRIAALLHDAPLCAEELLDCLAHTRHHAEQDMRRAHAERTGRLQ